MTKREIRSVMFEFSILAQQLLNGLVLGAIYGLIAIGYSLVYGIIGMINFAHGDIYMIAAYLTAICIAVITFFGINSIVLTLFLTFTFVVLITSLYGFSLERLAYRRLRYSPRLAPLISAIGMSIILQEYVRISQGARNQAIPALLEGKIHIPVASNPIDITAEQILIIVVSSVCVACLSFLIKNTSLGRAMRATQQDMQMAEILGVSLNKIIPLVFVLGSMMAGIAGVLVSVNYGSFNYAIGFIVGIKAFTSAVLGGIGSLTGAMLGGLILGLSESLFAGYVSVDYKDVFAFSILILVLIFKPNGLLGTHDVAKV